MKKLILMIFLCALLLAACGGREASGPETTAPQATYATTPPEETTPSSTAPVEETTIPAEETSAPTEPTTAPTEPPITEPPVTEPEHSALYIPGVDVEDVILWFSEVSLSAEFINSGNPSFVQKWDSPILYMIHGQPTEEDLTVLTSFTQWLNALEGFPGISETTDPMASSLDIHFCTQQELIGHLGDHFYGMDGGVTFWYTGDNQIYDAIICVRTDLDQYLRNSVILEELYNCLGPIQDTSLREDSLIYAGYSDPQELTQIDQLILALLYHPDMKCGMKSAQCEALIRQLYY